MRLRLIGAVLVVLLPLAAGAQSSDGALARDETLADIRQQLVILNTDITSLRRELSTTGGAFSAGGALSGVTAGSTLQRMDAIEAAMQQLTAKTEALEFRVNQIVVDGTNRIGDLEFRLVELEGGDVSGLGQTSTLGGVSGGPSAPVIDAPVTGGAELAIGEQADFNRAQQVFAAGDYRRAADLFEAFTQTYTGGPLTGDAHFQRGEALTQLGETAAAARAYLESFSGSPNGPRAPEALLRLGTSLGRLGQTPEACVTLTEVGVRFPGTGPATEAAAAKQGLGCS